MNIPLRRLGTSNIKITGAGLGTAPISSTKEWKGIFWGDIEERAGVETFIAAQPDAGWKVVLRSVGRGSWTALSNQGFAVAVTRFGFDPIRG